MKTVKVFIASSEELRLERLEIADMIQQLNRVLKPWDVEIDPLDNYDEYYRKLKNCEMCLVLYWTKFEDQTKNEDAAYLELCAGRNSQKIYVYFKDTKDITPELKNFKESFSTKYGHFFCRFENVDTMRLNFLPQVDDCQNKPLEVRLKVRDLRVKTGGDAFHQLFPVVVSIYDEMLSNDRDRAIHDPEHFDSVASTLNILGCLHYQTRCFDKAEQEFGEALEIYRRSAEGILDASDSYVADTLNNLGCLHYQTQCFDKAEQEFGEVLEIRRRLAESDPDIFDRDVAETLNKLAALHSNTRRFEKAEQEYKEALEIRRLLVAKNPEASDSYVADTLNNMGCLHFQTQCFDKAEQEFGEALKIYRCLAEKNPDASDVDVADTLNNLAILHSCTQRFDKAEQEYNEALKIYRCLAEEKRDASDSDVADTLNNLAILHSCTQRFDKAEQEFGEALKIYRCIAEKNPDASDVDVADTLNNLAILHSYTQRFGKAEQEYNETRKHVVVLQRQALKLSTDRQIIRRTI